MSIDSNRSQEDTKPMLTVEDLCDQAREFASRVHLYPDLQGVTDGKKIGTRFEIEFIRALENQFSLPARSAARGIDFPEPVGVDMKVTKSLQPQSSTRYTSPVQKVYGVAHGLLVFVYKRLNDGSIKVTRVKYIPPEATADFKLTKKLRELIEKKATEEEVFETLKRRKLPGCDAELRALANRIIHEPPAQGEVTISNALQWRLNYGRAMRSESPRTCIQTIYSIN